MILLDTCSLIWWTLFPDELSKSATEACGRIPHDGATISSISIWEIGVAIRRKRLDVGTTLETYTKRVRQLGIEIIAVDENIWIENLSLDWEHRDPADRTIVATAKLRKLSIVTSDKHIRKFFKFTIW